MKKRISWITLALAVMMLFVGCSQSGGKLEKIEEAGKIVVYTNANFPPFEYMDGTQPAGVDMEIAEEIAAALGVSLEIKDADFEGLISSLASGKGDIAISGFTITEERQKSVDFSSPYIKSVQYMILPYDSPIAFMEDLQGIKIGVALGYTGDFIIDDEVSEGVLMNNSPAVTKYNSAVDGSLEVVNGKIDAMIMDEYVAKNIVSQNNKLKALMLTYADGTAAEEEYAVAVPKGNEDLIKKINEVIDRLVSEGKIEEWVVKHS